jgi:glucose/arabinose dehydrogenase/cytochrome c553
MNSSRVETAVVTALAFLILTTTCLAQPRYGAIGELYQEICAACHGAALEGTPLGVPLAGADLDVGNSVEAIQAGIRNGNSDAGMPAFAEVLDADQIQALGIFVLEQRQGYTYDHYGIRAQIEIPGGVQNSDHHDFVLDTLIENLSPLPYSITPLPDGRLLLSEKKRGLSFISADGRQSEVVPGTPRIYDDSTMSNDARALDRGLGWMHEAALHPDYESNGWIYIYYGDRCESCNEISREENAPVSMAKVVRGRIRDGVWTDEETIWSSAYEHYTVGTDLSLGGRLAFDGNGHVYFSVGAKNGFYDLGIQDLDRPWGKIHRVSDDGTIPPDNPFVGVQGAIESIWTLGHRVPQGLEYDPRSESLWSTEHGARGGDEINLIERGGNYGWPLVTSGVHYDGTSIEDRFDTDFDRGEIRRPVADLIPSPAISSFVVYYGEAFPAWEGNLIVGSLKANALFRFSIVGNELLERELLIDGIGRIRDIAVDSAGEILLLIENASGGKIVRVGAPGI